MKARVYGPVLGRGSLAVVTEGFVEALTAAGLLAGVYGTDWHGIPGEEPTDGSDAPVGIYLGNPSSARVMLEKGRHARHFIMVTPNSTELPAQLVKDLKKLADDEVVQFMAPSRWATKIVQHHLGSCITVPHGVSAEYAPNPDVLRSTRDDFLKRGRFRVIHFSTSDRERKGTAELLRAWEVLRSDGWAPGAELLCVMDHHALQALEDARADGELPDWSVGGDVHLVPRGDLAHGNMSFTLQRSHVVCQPSRGEGFGLIPLQALCSGVPIVVTSTTGHSEYLTGGVWSDPGVEIILSGKPAPIDDLPGALAPQVTPSWVAAALARARVDWLKLHADLELRGATWRTEWRWPVALKDFIENELREP
jgi:glycosyltransferase involved in cell wall biosynthesis